MVAAAAIPEPVGEIPTAFLQGGPYGAVLNLDWEAAYETMLSEENELFGFSGLWCVRHCEGDCLFCACVYWLWSESLSCDLPGTGSRREAAAVIALRDGTTSPGQPRMTPLRTTLELSRSRDRRARRRTRGGVRVRTAAVPWTIRA
jgi:hypothetical protein